MGMEWYKDLSIFVFCSIFSIVLILAGVFGTIIALKMRAILNSVKAAVGSAQRVMETFEVELKKPLLQLVTMAQAIYQAIQTVSNMTKKKP